jgi:hypothetical protein
VFSKPRSKMVLYGYSMSTTSKVMHYVRDFFGVPNDTDNVITPIGLILLPPKP